MLKDKVTEKLILRRLLVDLAVFHLTSYIKKKRTSANRKKKCMSEQIYQFLRF